MCEVANGLPGLGVEDVCDMGNCCAVTGMGQTGLKWVASNVVNGAIAMGIVGMNAMAI